MPSDFQNFIGETSLDGLRPPHQRRSADGSAREIEEALDNKDQAALLRAACYFGKPHRVYLTLEIHTGDSMPVVSEAEPSRQQIHEDCLRSLNQPTKCLP